MAAIPKGMTRKILSLSWRSVVANKIPAWSIVVLYCSFAVLSIWITSLRPPMDDGKPVGPIDITPLCGFFVYPYWMYGIIKGFKNIAIATLVGRFFAMWGYSILFFLGLMVLAVPVGLLIALMYRIGVAPVWIFSVAAPLFLGFMYITLRMQLLFPAVIAGEKVGIKHIWNLSSGWVLPGFFAIMAVTLPYMLLALSIGVLSGLATVLSGGLMPTSFMICGLALASALYILLSSGIVAHTYRAARAYAALPESSNVPSESA